MAQIFVYGTLRRDGRLHGYYMDKATFQRMVKTAPKFTLYSLGGCPGLVEGGTTAVVGEVYECPAEVVEYLDRLEGHPHCYERKVIDLEDGSRVQAYVLPMRKTFARNAIIQSGDWLRYQHEMGT